MRKSIVLRHFYWKRLLFPFAFCSSWVVVGLVPPPKALVHFVHSSALGGGTLPTTITRKKGQKSTGAISNAKWRRKIPLFVAVDVPSLVQKRISRSEANHRRRRPKLYILRTKYYVLSQARRLDSLCDGLILFVTEDGTIINQRTNN